jgi:hypothetical protein
MPIQFGNQFISISSDWTEFKINARQRGYSLQYQIEGETYFIFGIDGPLAFNCVIWTGIVPDGVINGGYSQAQNDADKADFETNFKKDANQPLAPVTSITIGNKSREFKQIVEAASTVYDDVTIPSGKTWRVRFCEGHANYQGTTSVSIIWDRRGTPDTLSLTYGDVYRETNIDLVGDGVKMLSIRLSNGSVNPVELFGAYEATEL